MQSKSIAVLAVFAVLTVNAALAKSPTARGAAIAQKHCARCHAIGKNDPSPMGLAPPFRDLSKRYPIEALGEALAEGIVVGHPAMPQFIFEPHEINDLLTFISGLKSREPSPKKK